MSRAHLILDDEAQDALRESCRRMFAQAWPPSRANEYALNGAHRSALWRNMAEQGLLALGARQEDALGLHAAGVVLEEIGYAAVPLPVIDCILLNLALADHDPVAARLLERLHAGAAQTAFLWVDHVSGNDRPSLRENPDGVALDLNQRIPEGMPDLTQIAVGGLVPGRLAIFDAGAGVEQVEIPGPFMNAAAKLTFRNAHGRLVHAPVFTAESYLSLRRLAVTCRAAGAVKRGLELAADYAKSRRQFGAAISSFQAIQHKLANVLLAASGVSAAAMEAAKEFDLGMPSWAYRANAAFAHAAVALRQAAVEVQHAFGAAAYWESHEMPRHFRRVQADLAEYGGVHAARASVADSLLDRPLSGSGGRPG